MHADQHIFDEDHNSQDTTPPCQLEKLHEAVPSRFCQIRHYLSMPDGNSWTDKTFQSPDQAYCRLNSTLRIF